jgi:four helix bundle protein
MKKIENFKDLNIWQKGMDLVELVYTLTSKFPDFEKYALSSQMRRAAISIPSNTAEGFARKSNKEYRQFLFIVLGSSAELETQIIIARKQKYISAIEEELVLEHVDHINRMTKSLQKKLE